MKDLSIDLETMGTNIDSQILSIGLVLFDIKTGETGETLYLRVDVDQDENINATMGTVKFWLEQAVKNPGALKGVLDSNDSNTPMCVCLHKVKRFVEKHQPESVWANGTKFDLGMMEYQFKEHNMKIPWSYNADSCLRTLRKFAGKLDIPREGTAHNALSDAIRQAKYISAAVNKLNLLQGKQLIFYVDTTVIMA